MRRNQHYWILHKDKPMIMLQLLIKNQKMLNTLKLKNLHWLISLTKKDTISQPRDADLFLHASLFYSLMVSSKKNQPIELLKLLVESSLPSAWVS